ncbi:MAG: helix-turn-helix transcriptional regulator [Bacteroidaceae bacterium]|nr:helix-turn-helix transcriptional regulator [Bacteroidaceae bacterium]
MSNEARIERIKELMKSMGLKQIAFAERIGMDASNFSKHMKGKLPLGDTLLNKVVVELGVSKEWLLTGEGDMWQRNARNNQLPTVTVPVGDLDMTGSTIGGARVYDLDVTAGGMARERMFADEQVIGTINMPAIHPDCCIVRVSGDSMAPVIGNGDLIAIREVRNPNLIFWGQIYVVLLDDYRMVKYVRRHPDPSQVILRSENSNYDDIEVAKSDIRDLFLVENIIRIDSRV